MSLKYNSTMKVKFIVALSIILVSGTSSSSVNDAFLANTKDVVLMEFSDGSRYEGEFLNNQRNGYGVMVYQDGAKYQEGSRYEGEWLNDMRHGNGEMIYLNDGRRLRGLFKENAFVGS